jgi:amidophosphoribosyltransferase
MNPVETQMPDDDTVDKFKDECGVFGIFGHPDAAHMTYLGLYALQHRGQESAGMAVASDGRIKQSRAMGYVSDVFKEDVLRSLVGRSAIGHVRYSTFGDSRVVNAQPILIHCSHGQIALCHNGNLVNASELREELVRKGSIFQTNSDTEVVLHLYARSTAKLAEDAIVESVSQVKGAFSLALLTPERLIAVRDPHGFRPLALGKLGDAYVVCSETCAMDLIGATYEREIEPGEVLVIDRDGPHSYKPFAPTPAAHCVFEHVYFARPDSYVFGQSVNEVRTNLGRLLAGESGVEADVVVPIPDSGMCAAVGYAESSGIPLKMGLIRNHYVGRTFIQPQQSIRGFKVKVKLNTVRSIIEGKRVVLVDDSIVRGTTSQKIVAMVKAAGAREVHMRISCPPTVSPCYYGIDTPHRDQLIAAKHTVEEIRNYLGADSLSYLSLEGLRESVGVAAPNYCNACYTREYPVEPPSDAEAYMQMVFKLPDGAEPIEP